jgi:hypothetical protein
MSWVLSATASRKRTGQHQTLSGKAPLDPKIEGGGGLLSIRYNAAAD